MSSSLQHAAPTSGRRAGPSTALPCLLPALIIQHEDCMLPHRSPRWFGSQGSPSAPCPAGEQKCPLVSGAELS